jgi:hypothetical protein
MLTMAVCRMKRRFRRTGDSSIRIRPFIVLRSRVFVVYFPSNLQRGESMGQTNEFRITLPALAAAALIAAGPAQALPLAPVAPAAQSQPELTPTQIRAGFHGGGHRGGAVVRGPRGGAAVVHGGGYRGGVHGAYRGGFYRGGRYYGGGAWVRPYRWAPGGAIAAGAAIGVIGAATAAAWASAPPQPGLCWYYTDPSQRNGFWDTCP